MGAKMLTTRAVRIHTLMIDYWNHHANTDRRLRRKLGLAVDRGTACRRFDFESSTNLLQAIPRAYGHCPEKSAPAFPCMLQKTACTAAAHMVRHLPRLFRHEENSGHTIPPSMQDTCCYGMLGPRTATSRLCSPPALERTVM